MRLHIFSRVTQISRVESEVQTLSVWLQSPQSSYGGYSSEDIHTQKRGRDLRSRFRYH